MKKKRHSQEQIIRKLREAAGHPSVGMPSQIGQEMTSPFLPGESSSQ